VRAVNRRTRSALCFARRFTFVKWERTLPSSASARASPRLAFGESFFERRESENGCHIPAAVMNIKAAQL
jgi:hypothetical protein